MWSLYGGEAVIVKILGPEDFKGYELNDPTKHTGPSRPWELIEYPDGLRVWVPRKALFNTKNQCEKAMLLKK